MFEPEPGEVEILREMLLLLLPYNGAVTKLANKNGHAPTDSCESEEARRIWSESRVPL